MADLQIQNQNNGLEKQPFAEYLSEVNLEFKEQEVAEKAKSLNIPYIRVENVPINPDLLDHITREQSERGKIIPFHQSGKKIRVAVCEPNREGSREIVQELKNNGYEIEISLASEDGIKKAQSMYYSAQYFEKKNKNAQVAETDSATQQEVENLAQLKEKITKVSQAEALELLHAGVIKTRASDLHIQPLNKEKAAVRFRIDGKLMDIFEMPLENYEQIVKQIKYLSHLKLNITKTPQDGKYSFMVNNRQIDMRVSTMPSVFGESIVIRVLDSKRGILNFADLGFEKSLITRLEKQLRRPHGLILVTGPTGSGKTTTLYSMLHFLNTSDRKVITLEDPIEYNLTGITQSQVDTEQDYSFNNGLRAILRHDPDVLMIGEIRDTETAQTAAQAALTGHIVFSTLHTNSAIETIPRLINMGLPAFMTAPSLNMIIAQRLVRKVCDCALEKEPTDSEKKHLQKIVSSLQNRGINIPNLNKIKTPRGCEKCSHTGYYGQTSIMEILEIDPELRELILNEEHNSQQILNTAKQKGFLTMRELGVMKILQGITTVSEVWRVT